MIAAVAATMDPWQILYAFLGAFFGFGLAQLAAFFLMRRSGKKNRNKIKKSLLDELVVIKKIFIDCPKDEDIAPFEIPVWNSVIATGNILVMLQEDNEFYNKLLTIYNHCLSLRKMEEKPEKFKGKISGLKIKIINMISAVTKNMTDERTNEEK